MWLNLAGASKIFLEKNKLRLKVIIFSTLFAITNISCSGNILTELSNKTDNNVLLADAKDKLNSSNFTAAIATCTLMSAAYLLTAEAAYTCASAFAGRAGLNLITLINDISAYTGTPNLLPYLMTKNNGAVAQDLTDLETARDLLRGLGGASVRSADQNALMTLISLQSLGVAGNLYADTDDDGNVDGGYDSCDTVTDLPAAGGLHFTNALWEIKESAGSSNIPNGSALATIITTACTTLAGANVLLDFCSQTDPTAFTVNEVKGARSLISEDLLTFGFADANGTGSTIPACICP